NKKMHLAGISLEDIYYNAFPLDAVVGATFPVLWAPSVSPAAEKLAARMRRGISGPVGGRHYLGYMAAWSLFERIEAAGTTDAGKLAAAFADYRFDAAKNSPSVYHGFDHQCAQDVYGGATVSRKQFEKTQFMYEVVATVPAEESDGNAGSPWAKAAQQAMAAQTVGTREGYTPKSV
ncbi:MAG: hypothetical protein ABR975_15860, partial [Vulcanimicrobiaceae bacterium]